MAYNPRVHHRRSIRLQGYDYTQPGKYFVTICVSKREHLLGHIQNGEMHLNLYGESVKTNWDYLPKIYPHVELDAFIIMPNHIHCIIVLKEETAEAVDTSKIRHQGLPEIVRALKTSSATRINQLRKVKGISVWQRGYYEHIIRNEDALAKIRQYIVDNPVMWDKDNLNKSVNSKFTKQINAQVDPDNHISITLHW
ncbi:transposase [Calothrix sp. HK-06]|nr:transposase [Calothrix sp. HK-06]